MKFNDLDARLRAFESADDPSVPPGTFLVARLDGRGFTKLTKKQLPLDRPFDPRFRDWMLATARHLAANSGASPLYTYTQSDEISVLFHPDEDVFGRKIRKLLSVLAGEASAAFTHASGQVGVFDCRLSPLPTLDLVVDYFRWRNEDAARNAMNAHCYWALRARGDSARAATSTLQGMGHGDKHEFLFSVAGTNFNELPLWQRRGSGLYLEWYEKEGHNPKTGETTTVRRRRLATNTELPMREAYNAFLRELISAQLG